MNWFIASVVIRRDIQKGKSSLAVANKKIHSHESRMNDRPDSMMFLADEGSLLEENKLIERKKRQRDTFPLR
jgi:hypothetical protein